jgi:crotonobetainyl-CoA:carnitine CoA-transferase CaiB-like acyl-CoA transferase
VQDYAEITRDPQVKHMECLVTTTGVGPNRAPVTLVNHPVRYDGKAASVALAPQNLGAQTDDVLAELGYGAADIAALERDGVVKRAPG